MWYFNSHNNKVGKNKPYPFKCKILNYLTTFHRTILFYDFTMLTFPEIWIITKSRCWKYQNPGSFIIIFLEAKYSFLTEFHLMFWCVYYWIMGNVDVIFVWNVENSTSVNNCSIVDLHLSENTHFISQKPLIFSWN